MDGGGGSGSGGVAAPPTGTATEEAKAVVPAEPEPEVEVLNQTLLAPMKDVPTVPAATVVPSTPAQPTLVRAIPKGAPDAGLNTRVTGLRHLLSLKAQALRTLHDLQRSSMFIRTMARYPQPARRRSHWDAVLEESMSVANDVHHEREWKVFHGADVARQCASVLRSLRRRRATMAGGASTDGDGDVDMAAPVASDAGAGAGADAGAGAGSQPNDFLRLLHASSSRPACAAMAAAVRRFWATVWHRVRLRGPLAPYLKPIMPAPPAGEPAYAPADAAAERKPRTLQSLHSTCATVRSVIFKPAVTSGAGSGPLASSLRGRDMMSVLRRFLPTPLARALRRYQIDALRWVDALLHCNLNAVLADDPGLGKRVTCIAAIAVRVNELMYRAELARRPTPAAASQHGAGGSDGGAGAGAGAAPADAVGAGAGTAAAANGAGTGAGAGTASQGDAADASAPSEDVDMGSGGGGDSDGSGSGKHGPRAWPSLVVTPPGAVLHWVSEVRRWAPGFVAECLVSPVSEASLRRLTPRHIVIVTPAVMRENADVLTACKWLVAVGDAYLKPQVPASNPGTLRMLTAAAGNDADSDAAQRTKGGSPSRLKAGSNGDGGGSSGSGGGGGADGTGDGSGSGGVPAGTTRLPLRHGVIVPFDLMTRLDTGQRIALVSSWLPTTLDGIGPLARFLLPDVFPDEAFVNDWIRKHAGAGAAALESPWTVDASRLRNEVLPVTLARRVPDLVAALPKRRDCCTKPSLGPQQRAAMQAVYAGGKMQQAVQLASTQGNLSALLRVLCRLHAVCQGADLDPLRADAVTAGAGRAPMLTPLEGVVVELPPCVVGAIRGSGSADGAGIVAARVEAALPELGGALPLLTRTDSPRWVQARIAELAPLQGRGGTGAGSGSGTGGGRGTRRGGAAAKDAAAGDAAPFARRNEWRCTVQPMLCAALVAHVTLPGVHGAVHVAGHPRPVRIASSGPALAHTAATARLLSLAGSQLLQGVQPAAELAWSTVRPQLLVQGAPRCTYPSPAAKPALPHAVPLPAGHAAVVGAALAAPQVQAALERRAMLQAFAHVLPRRPSELLAVSSKLAVLRTLLREAAALGRRVVVLTSLPDAVPLVQELLDAMHVLHLRLDQPVPWPGAGAAVPVPGVMHQRAIDLFNRDARYTVALACTAGLEDAGTAVVPHASGGDDDAGIGAGLSCASVLGADTVVLFDVELAASAATQRRILVERMCRGREVSIVQLVSAGTLEDGIANSVASSASSSSSYVSLFRVWLPAVAVLSHPCVWCGCWHGVDVDVGVGVLAPQAEGHDGAQHGRVAPVGLVQPGAWRLRTGRDPDPLRQQRHHAVASPRPARPVAGAGRRFPHPA